ncbi:MAG: peptidylprolyl isomerase [Muribaculaceae bacterium]|nr:peptidylprolyl isomerase [Muribaculaceae bacterium]
MKKLLLTATVIAATAASLSAADKDPVLMTVDGHDIHVSEFEYLYNKNNSQQLQQQSLDEYLNMFVDYKLKVADAEHAGIQNSEEFLSEFNKFRAELAAPYFRSQTVEDELVNESYEHHKYDVYVSHIMVPLSDDKKQLLDSLRTAIISGKTTFEAAASHSIDRGSATRGGQMGFVVPDRFPWAFEKAAYDTPVGEISPVVNSGMGYHIIRVEQRKPTAGQVLAAHILRLTRGKSAEDAQHQKVVIDSLYNELQTGADFADLAKRFSEDPGSGRNGGMLPWFGKGTMVAEFDSISFALGNSELSTPFATSYGYHIIKKYDHKSVPALDELREKILENMKRDERGHAAEDAFIAELMTKYNGTVDKIVLDRAEKMISENGGYDSTVVARLAAMDVPVATYDGGAIKLSELIPSVPASGANTAADARNLIEQAAHLALQEAVLENARQDLIINNADYRNLVNEYRDGILLYEISNRNVWDKAAKDTEGLDKFFKANIDQYRWETPKFKSYVFFASSDSLLNVAIQYADSLSTDNQAAFTQDMRKRFGRDIKVERVIAAKGENAITDYLAFGGPKPESDKKTKWEAYGAYKGRILDGPEEAGDVRGAAVTDYQTQLDKEWVAQLHERYKVKVNKKVFEKLKKQQK